MADSGGNGRHAFRMVGLREHIHRLYRFYGEAAPYEVGEVSGECVRVAGNIDGSNWLPADKGVKRCRMAADTGRVKDYCVGSLCQ